MVHYILFPDGRRVSLSEVLGFIYGLNQSELKVLDLLIRDKEKLTAEEIERRLNLTKIAINRSLTTLLVKGLIHEERQLILEDQLNDIARLRVSYFANEDELYDKVIKDLENMKNAFLTKFYQCVKNSEKINKC